MPRVLTINGYIFYFFAADCKERAHMHVKKGDGNGKIWIKPEIEVYYLNLDYALEFCDERLKYKKIKHLLSEA
ncbi:MAG: DUF4160 domain-containing protein [Cyclobacteriaceae bacterium]